MVQSLFPQLIKTFIGMSSNTPKDISCLHHILEHGGEIEDIDSDFYGHFVYTSNANEIKQITNFLNVHELYYTTTKNMDNTVSLIFNRQITGIPILTKVELTQLFNLYFEGFSPALPPQPLVTTQQKSEKQEKETKEPIEDKQSPHSDPIPIPGTPIAHPDDEIKPSMDELARLFAFIFKYGITMETTNYFRFMWENMLTRLQVNQVVAFLVANEIFCINEEVWSIAWTNTAEGPDPDKARYNNKIKLQSDILNRASTKVDKWLISWDAEKKELSPEEKTKKKAWLSITEKNLKDMETIVFAKDEKKTQARTLSFSHYLSFNQPKQQLQDKITKLCRRGSGDLTGNDAEGNSVSPLNKVSYK